MSQPRVRPLLVALTFIGFISLGLPDGLLGVAWPSMAGSLGVGLDDLGQLLAAGSVGFLITSVLSGRLLARLGVGVLLGVSCGVTGASLIAYSVIDLWPALLLFALLLGAGGGAIDSGLNAYAAANYSPRALNWLHASFGLGATAGPLIMTAVLDGGQPWQLGYTLVGGAQLSLAVGFALSRRQWVGVPSREAPGQASVDTPLRATLVRPDIWLGCLLFVCYAGLEVSIGQWSYTLLTVGRGVTPSLAGQWVGVYWGGLTAGRVLAGLLAARVRLRTMAGAGALGALLGALLIWLDPGSWLSALGLLLSGMALAPIFPALIALTADRVGPAHAANAIGLQVAAANLGIASLPWLIGLAIDTIGIATIGPGLVIYAVLHLGLYLVVQRR